MFSTASRGPLTSFEGPNKNHKMGSSWKVDGTDWPELEKFKKLFTVRAAQVIVQSRLGGKVNIPCSADDKKAWFNLCAPDGGGEYIKEASRVWNESMPSSKPICVEISLKTPEADTMVLEMWTLGGCSDPSDTSTKWKLDLYTRICTLLKSVISVTRCLPAYQLSRRQGPDSFVICYRMFSGDPQYLHLGENYNQARIGGIATPRGPFLISLAYRTKMTLSPQQSGRDNSIMLKSDHFRPDMSPQLITRRDKSTPPVSPKDLESSFDSLKLGAFADVSKLIPPPDSELITECPFSSLLIKKKIPPRNSTLSTPVPTPAPTPLGYHADNDNDNAQYSSDSNGNLTPRASPTTNSRRSSCSLASANDDFIMVDLKPTFSWTSGKTDLGEFLTQCQSAPPLQTFQEIPTLQDHLKEIDEVIVTCETESVKYDQMLKIQNCDDFEAPTDGYEIVPGAESYL